MTNELIRIFVPIYNVEKCFEKISCWKRKKIKYKLQVLITSLNASLKVKLNGIKRMQNER